jgi:hypothetical protein
MIFRKHLCTDNAVKLLGLTIEDVKPTTLFCEEVGFGANHGHA